MDVNKEMNQQPASDNKVEYDYTKYTGEVTAIEIDRLENFKKHPFKPYEGKRFTSLVESIRHNGIHIPIIARPLEGDKFEILSGHNRVRAAREAKHIKIPARILPDITDEVAMLIVTETNLYQRSTTDMKPSELALALTAHYEATKKQGKRDGLIQAIEKIVSEAGNPSETSGTVYQKLDSREQAGAIYGMSSRNVGHYLRIDKLAKSLKERLDKGGIAKRTAVALSYLSKDNQNMVNKVLNNEGFSITEREAESLRELGKSKELSKDKIVEILSRKRIASKSNKISIPLDSIRQHFEGQEVSEKEMIGTILKALELYGASANK